MTMKMVTTKEDGNYDDDNDDNVDLMPWPTKVMTMTMKMETTKEDDNNYDDNNDDDNDDNVDLMPWPTLCHPTPDFAASTSEYIT